MNRTHTALKLYIVLLTRTRGNRICKYSFLGLSSSTSTCQLEPRAQHHGVLTLTCQVCHNRLLAVGTVIHAPVQQFSNLLLELRNFQQADGLSPTDRQPASRSRDIDMSRAH